MTTELATITPTAPTRRGSALMPTTLAEAMELSTVLAKSTIVPKDFANNPGNCLVAIQWGAELGLAPLQAMQNIAVINGRPSLWGDAVIALVRASGMLDSIDEKLGDDAAACTVKRSGQAPVTRTFSIEDAKRAGLLGKQGPWQQYPKRMLQMRARAWALRDVFADVLRGLAIAEEARDMPPVKDMGAVEQVAPPPATPADKVRAALDKRKAKESEPPTQEPAQTAEELAAKIAGAADAEALTAATEAAIGACVTDADKEAVRAAYKKRVSELKAAAAAAAAPADPMAAHQDFLAGMDNQ